MPMPVSPIAIWRSSPAWRADIATDGVGELHRVADKDLEDVADFIGVRGELQQGDVDRPGLLASRATGRPGTQLAPA